jgi:non-heme chloroperoxidase
VVPPKVRAALITRVINSDDVLGELKKPVLMTHGRSDTASWYAGVGHAPFIEDSSRFNRELSDFARKACALDGPRS